MKGKKIFVVANTAFTVINFRRELLELLIEEGAEVNIVVPSYCDLIADGNAESAFEELPLSLHSIDLQRNGLNPFSDLLYIFRLVLLFKRHKPDYILNYTIKPTIYSSLAAKIANVGTVFSNITGIGYALAGKSFKARVLNVIVSLLYRVALFCNSKVFFQNADDLSLFCDRNLLPPSKAVLLNGSGINTTRFRRKSTLPSNPSFIFVGRLLRDKGIFEFLRAAQSVRLANPSLNVRFSVAGQTDANPESISLSELEYWCAQGDVEYLGTVSDIRACLEEHQVLVLPSYREGTPRVCLEAMSMEMPLITTDAPGCREVIVDGYNGCRVPIRDFNALSEAMLKFVTKQCDPIEMGLNGRKIAISKYSVFMVNKQIVRTLLGDGV